MQEKSVLIVEDEGVVALSIQAALTKMGYTVVGIAVTGAEALSLAREHKPDVILMDIHIKGDMDGIQTTEKLNEVSDIPVIFLTAYADDETVKRALKTKSTSYLVKPYNPRELYSNIEFAIYKRRMKDRAGSHRENLELFFTRSSGAGLIIDMQNRVVFANSAAEILLGWTVEEMRGKNFFSLVNPSASTADGPIDDTVKGILDLEAVDYLPPLARISTKSDRIRTVSLKTAIVREEDGENRFLMILMQ
ncbi:MAG: PAS sensor protein [Methanomicrobiales archaeon HGW-Methanomicrobiales-3]|nr:MAG: PAS sensor protein [Methanomicrobiales archaeon HGW-Methanomicrobiales-3]